MSKLIQPKQLQPGSNNYVLTSSGSTVLWAAVPSFTGNTSGDCISDIYVTNIHSCSPLFINPLDEGNVYIGSESGFTYDVSTSGLTIAGNIDANGYVDTGDDFRKEGTTIFNVQLGGNGNTSVGELGMNIDTISGAIRNTTVGYDAGR